MADDRRNLYSYAVNADLTVGTAMRALLPWPSSVRAISPSLRPTSAGSRCPTPAGAERDAARGPGRRTKA